MTLKHALLALAALASLALASTAQADVLPVAPPEAVGLSSERLEAITDRLEGGIRKGEIPGAVLLIARRGKIAYFEALGHLDPQHPTSMPKDAIFRIYSMSKPITSVAAMILFEEGKLTLEQPVAQYLPQFAKLQVAADNKPTGRKGGRVLRGGKDTVTVPLTGAVKSAAE